MGSSQRELAPSARCSNPWDRGARARRLLGRLGCRGGGAPGAGGHRHRHRRLDPPAGRASAASPASSRPTARVALRHDRLRLEPGPGRAARPQRATIAPCMLDAMAGFRRARFDQRGAAGRGLHALRWASTLKGLRIGLPHEFFGQGLRADVEAAVRAAVEAIPSARRASCVDIDPAEHRRCAVPVYYVVAPAEASSPTCRASTASATATARASYRICMEMYQEVAREGFGAEVKRRIMVGTYVLSHGYYDAYYLQGAEGPAPDRAGFPARVRDVRRDRRARRPTVGLRLRREDRRPGAMYLADIFTLPASLAGLPGMIMPCGFGQRGLPVGLQLIGNHFDEARLLGVAHRSSRPPTGTARSARLLSKAQEHDCRPMGSRHRSRDPRPAADRTRRSSRGASTAFGASRTTQASPVDLALPGVLPVLNAARSSARSASAARWARASPRARCSPARTTSIPTCPRATRSASTSCRWCQGGRPGRATWTSGSTPSDRPDARPPGGGRRQVAARGVSRTVTGIDLNRAGTPLLEIVTEPDMRSAAEAVAYAKTLHALVRLARHLRRQHAGRQLPLRRQRVGAAGRRTTSSAPAPRSRTSTLSASCSRRSNTRSSARSS